KTPRATQRRSSDWYEHRQPPAPERAPAPGAAGACRRGRGFVLVWGSVHPGRATRNRPRCEIRPESGRSRGVRHEELPAILGTAVRLLARRPRRGADEREAAREGIRVHRRELRRESLL